MKSFGYAIVSIFLAVVVLLTSGGISIVRCCQTHCFCLQNSGTQEVDLFSDRYSSESRNDCCKTGGIADKHATKGHSIVDIPTGTDWGIQGTIDLTYSFGSVIFAPVTSVVKYITTSYMPPPRDYLKQIAILLI